MEKVRFGREERFLDRLLVSGVIEARGTERLGIVAEHLTDEELKAFYRRLTRAEEQHFQLFYKIATKFFPESTVNSRLDYWLEWEANIIKGSAIRPAVH
jgi:tRNA-(ms[2]io[6]A)-hydroxylase